MAILILIFLNIRRRREQMLAEEKLFLMLVYSDALLLVLDSLMWVLDGQPGNALRMVNILAAALYYAMNPLICLVWFAYVDYQIYRDVGHLKKLLFPMAIPAVLNLGLSVSSIWTGLGFYYDSANVYHRGILFPVMAVISFFYLAYAWIQAMVKRRRIPKQGLLPHHVFYVYACRRRYYPVVFSTVFRSCGPVPPWRFSSFSSTSRTFASTRTI